MTTNKELRMNNEKIDLLKKFIIPHVGLTAFKYRAKAAAFIKELNLGITIDQFIILKILNQFPNIAQQELCDMIYKDKSNFSRMADDLEAKGYLTRTPDFKGKRVVKKLCITEEGINLTEKITPLAYKLHAKAISGISQEELDTLKSVLAKIRANLDACVVNPLLETSNDDFSKEHDKKNPKENK